MKKSAPDAKPESTFSKGFLKPTPEPPKGDVEKISVEKKQRSDNSARVLPATIVSGSSATVSEDDARKIIGNYDKTLSHRDDSRLVISNYIRSLAHDSAEL